MKKFYFVILGFFLALQITSCATVEHKDENLASQWEPQNVVVIPYQLGITNTQSSRASSPLSGSTYRSGEIIPNAQVVMDQILSIQLPRYTHLTYIDCTQASLVYDPLIRSNPASIKQAALETARRLDADAVMIGFIYRFAQRVGSDFGAEKPASAAFDLYLIRVSDGAIMWKNSFDQAQTSLSENLFDLPQFLDHGLRWFTVEELAESGVGHLLERFPWGLHRAGIVEPYEQTERETK